MKKIVSFIVLAVFVMSCTNDENEEILVKEVMKLEENNKFKNVSRQVNREDVSFGLESDTIPPPPPSVDPEEIIDICPIDPPKGNTGGGGTKP